MEFPFEQITPNYLNPINNLMTDDLSVERKLICSRQNRSKLIQSSFDDKINISIGRKVNKLFFAH